MFNINCFRKQAKYPVINVEIRRIEWIISKIIKFYHYYFYQHGPIVFVVLQRY